MPANAKYFSNSRERFLKITAAILGGYLVSASFHLMLTCIPSLTEYVILISGITFFLLWAGLMICSFLAENGKKIWLLYAGLTILFSAIVWLAK